MFNKINVTADVVDVVGGGEAEQKVRYKVKDRARYSILIITLSTEQ